MNVTCTVCGNEQQDEFSQNADGELVCDLCGTQSFQQNRTETQDLDDAAGGRGMSGARIRKRKKTGSRLNNDDDRKARKVNLLDAISACDDILQFYCENLISNCDIPSCITPVVQSLWHSYLSTWEGHEQDLWSCIYGTNVEYFHPNSIEDFVPISSEVIKARNNRSFFRDQWNTKLFKASYLIVLCYVGTRVLNLGILPFEFRSWILEDKLPFASVFYRALSHDDIEFLAPIRHWFMVAGKFNTLSADAKLMEHWCNLFLPPMVNEMTVRRFIKAFDLPRIVYDRYHLLLNTSTIECGTSVAARLLIAIKTCIGWHQWPHVFTQIVQRPLVVDDIHSMPRRNLDNFVTQCHTPLNASNDYIKKHKLPLFVKEHVEELESVFLPGCAKESTNNNSVERNDVVSFWPSYNSNGVPKEPISSSPSYFYPVYTDDRNLVAYHAAYENLICLFAKYMNTDPGILTKAVSELEKHF